MNAAVAIFVKTPGHSALKTRLVAQLGRELAEDCHRRAAGCVAESVQRSGLPGYWAVAEVGAMDHPLWSNFPRLHQGAGPLGRRMARVHTELVQRHGGAILVGADLPQIEPEHLIQAADWLRAGSIHRVLGPARDGGFWLFGSNRAHALEQWEAPEYSQSGTASAFVDAIGGAGWKRLPVRTDLDEPSDLPAVVEELRAVWGPGPAQRELIDWFARIVGRSG